jgi:hypothetical protein
MAQYGSVNSKLQFYSKSDRICQIIYSIGVLAVGPENRKAMLEVEADFAIDCNSIAPGEHVR